MNAAATAQTASFPLVSETYYLDADALIMARECARGSYQHSLVEGQARWSGADLKGKASKYGAHYHTSRNALVQAMRAAGLRLTWLTAAHGRHVLVVSSEDCKVSAEGPRNGERLAVVTDHPAIECGIFSAI